MAGRRCRHCRCLFIPDPRNKDQKFCSKPECQKARKRLWQRRKTREEAYRLNQQDAQKNWQQNNPGYWKQYRRQHPAYTKRNREKQQVRNRLKRTMASISKQIANMDPFSDKNNNITGYYGLISVQDLVIAKMEAKIIKITELPDGYKDFTPDCKERTR
jgi:hypothetical protein